jgi:hypothetical protein
MIIIQFPEKSISPIVYIPIEQELETGKQFFLSSDKMENI